jgi:protein-S-isoprenylcysteine O-methyltransferase Ste14
MIGAPKMIIIILQVIGIFFFIIGTLWLGRWIRGTPEKETAEKASHTSHLLLYLCLVIPGLIGILYPGLTHYDELLGFPLLPFHSFALVIGIVLAVVGITLMIISNQSLIKYGKGAAAFVLTKQVVSDLVYQWTRNPMSLGYYLMCLGVSLLAGSTALTMGTLLMVIPVHIFYLKYFEEVELDIRYGQSYREYKQRVPFLIPKLIHKGN